MGSLAVRKKRSAAIEPGEDFSKCRSAGEERPLLHAEGGEQTPKPDLPFAGNFYLVRAIAENIEQIRPSNRKEKRARPESLPTKKRRPKGRLLCWFSRDFSRSRESTYLGGKHLAAVKELSQDIVGCNLRRIVRELWLGWKFTWAAFFFAVRFLARRG